MRSPIGSIAWLSIGLTIALAGTGLGIAAFFIQSQTRNDILAIIDRVLSKTSNDNKLDKSNSKKNKSTNKSSNSNNHDSDNSLKSYTEETFSDTVTELTADSLGIAHLYKSFQSASVILKLYLRLLSDKDMSEMEKITIPSFLHLLQRVERNGSAVHRVAAKVKIIVIEGLKRSGKSKLIHTIVPRLPSRYRAVIIPKEVEEVKEFFTSSPEPVAKAFECLCNYILVNEIYEDYESNPLDNRHYFIDSFYHSTCTKTIMSQVDTPDDQTIVFPSVYEWPLDLPIPNMVVYLHVPTEVRLRRFDEEAVMKCERSLHRSVARDEKTQIAFSLVKGPLTIAIDANTIPAEVCDVTIEALGEYGFIIPKGSLSSPSSHKRSSVGVYGALNQLP